MSTTLSPPDVARLAERAIHATLGGTVDDLAAIVHRHAVNREAIAEPPPTRGVGPAAFHATGQWLRAAFSDLAWTTERLVVEGDLAVTYGTLSGRQTGEFVVWTPDGTVERAFASTGKTFTVRQAHFQRIVDGLVTEHWAVRDDQGMAIQLGWIPPTPAFLFRCHRATKRARRAARTATTQRVQQPRRALSRTPMGSSDPVGGLRGHRAHRGMGAQKGVRDLTVKEPTGTTPHPVVGDTV